jgi:AcrR family transcriptional regulator
MTDLRVKGDVTKSRLLDATEHWISEKGFDSVSVRDITGLAKANVAAVHYHFGSRDGLLAAVLDHRMKPLMEMRAANLEALRDEDGVREVLKAWSSPLVSIFASAGMSELSYCRVMGRAMDVLASNIFTEASAANRLVDATLQHCMEQRLPGMTQSEISWRLHFSTGALIHLLVHGVTTQSEFRLSTAIEFWLDATAQSFAANDGLVERAPVKAPAARRKTKAVAPLRQMAEVVSAVMGADEIEHVSLENNATTPVLEASAMEQISPVTATAENPQEQAKAEIPAAKPKEDDGYGELFLF